jgi:hypothetical protein
MKLADGKMDPRRAIHQVDLYAPIILKLFLGQYQNVPSRDSLPAHKFTLVSIGE